MTPIRLMKRPSFGIAFSGGGVRGFAELGAWKALEISGIPKADMVVGTSAGSLVAACYALDLNSDDVFSFALGSGLDEILDIDDDDPNSSLPLKNILNEGKKLFSIVRDSGKIENLARRVIGDKTFADTSIPLTAIAVDLGSGDEVHLREGDIALACRASCSVPGIFSPTVIDDRILVDGYLLNNMGADVLKHAGMDVVLGIDINSDVRIPPASVKLFDVLSSTYAIMSNHGKRKNRPLCDVLVSPDLKGFAKRRAQKEQMAAMYRAGLNEMLLKIPELREKLGLDQKSIIKKLAEALPRLKKTP